MIVKETRMVERTNVSILEIVRGRKDFGRCRKMEIEYIASLSCGKDSLAMVLRLMEEGKPLTKCIMYDTGAEFGAIYRNIEKIKPILSDYGCEFVLIKPKTDFFFDMLVKPICVGKNNEHYGYDWCGGCTRWRTVGKMAAINGYLRKLGKEYKQYIGIAYDEPKRLKDEKNKIYPLVEWKMTEKDCLNYCYSHGWNWEENGVDLYKVLVRVSCWCCGNKNLKELKNMFLYLPEYWKWLKGLQSRIDRPFRRNGDTIFDLEKRFKSEVECTLF